MNIDFAYVPLDLGHDDGRVPRLESGYVLSSVVYWHIARNLYFDGNRLRPLSVWVGVAARSACHADSGNQHRGPYCEGPENRIFSTGHSRYYGKSQQVNMHCTSPATLLITFRNDTHP